MKGYKGNKFVLKLTKLLLIAIPSLALLIPIAVARLSGSLSEDAITERLQPMGKVNVDNAGAAAAPTLVAGVGGPKDIYEHNCKMCHGVGLAGAPKFGNKEDWAPRIAQGEDTLVKAAISGIRAMPPRGNCLQCTDADIKATVEYMINAAK